MNKGVSFVSSFQECKDQGEKDTKESLSDVITLVGRKFNKALMSMKNVQDKVLDNFKNIGHRHKSIDEDKPNRGEGIQYHECEGFCHIKYECHTFLKK